MRISLPCESFIYTFVVIARGSFSFPSLASVIHPPLLRKLARFFHDLSYGNVSAKVIVQTLTSGYYNESSDLYTRLIDTSCFRSFSLFPYI